MCCAMLPPAPTTTFCKRRCHAPTANWPATCCFFFPLYAAAGCRTGRGGRAAPRRPERQRPELAARLRTDLGQMTRNFDDPLSGEWRLQAVPFLHGADIDRLLLLVRDQDDNDDEENEKGGGTRFVVDLNLSRLGHLQIDGLVGNDNKRLDLVLRSDAPLEGTMRDDIRGLYANALELTGLEGSVGFQAAPGNFVEIPKGPSSKGTAGTGMVI